MTADTAQSAGYPKTIDLNGEDVVLRLIRPEDAAALHHFFVGLPVSDLLFMQRDVTDSREIDAWLAEIQRGGAVTLLAESDGMLLGETTLHFSRVPWTRHVATVRVTTDPSQRGRGLGRLLLEEIFHLAARQGIEKIVAEMTVEQVPAIKLFEQLGFREEGRYQGYIKDRRGIRHDLVIMTYDQPAQSGAISEGGAVMEPWRCDACGHVTMAFDSPNRCPDCGASAEHLSAVDRH